MAVARRTSLGGAREVALALSIAPDAGQELLEDLGCSPVILETGERTRKEWIL